MMICECEFSAFWMITPTSALPLVSRPVTVYGLESFGNAGTLEPGTFAEPAPPGPEAVGEHVPLPPPPPPLPVVIVKLAERLWAAPVVGVTDWVMVCLPDERLPAFHASAVPSPAVPAKS